MFPGFSEKTQDFLWGVRLNNERPWFEAHKQDYLDHVQTPLRALGEEVYEKFTAAHEELPLMLRISRIYRDARRLYGRGPYKSNLWFTLRMAGEDWTHMPVFWFEIYPKGYAYGLGAYDAKPAQMAKFRQAVDTDPKPMLKLARAFARQDRFALQAEEYKRPKGHAGDPLGRWYNRKRIGLECSRDHDAALYSPELPGILTDAYAKLMPMYEYFLEFYHSADSEKGEQP